MLIWNRTSTPVELHPLLETLAEEYPIAESENGTLLNFHSSRKNILQVANRSGKAEITYSTLPAAVRGIAMSI